MLHLAAAERLDLQRRMDRVMDGAAVHVGGKSATEWIATLRKTRDKL